MIELVLLVCLRLDPEQCEERVLLNLSQTQPQTCMMQAMPEIVAWSQAHPRLRVTRWFCRDGASRPRNA